MKTWCRKLSIMVAISGQLMAGSALAAIERVTAVPRHLSFKCSQWDFSRGFDISNIRPIAPSHSFKSEDIGKIIPSSLTPTRDSSAVANQIVDHSVNNLLNSDFMRKSELGRTAQAVEQKMSTNIDFGGKEPQAIKHSVKIAMMAAQGKANVEYRGLTNAQLTYHVNQASLNLEVHEKLPVMNTTLVFNHVNNPSFSKDMLSLRWAW